MEEEIIVTVEILHKDGKVYSFKAEKNEVKSALRKYKKGEGVLCINGIDEGYFFNMDEVSIINWVEKPSVEKAVKIEIEKRGFTKTDRDKTPIIEIIKAVKIAHGFSITELKHAYDKYFI